MDENSNLKHDFSKKDQAAKQEVFEFAHSVLVQELMKQSEEPLSENQAEILSREALEEVDIFSKENAEYRLDQLALYTLEKNGYQTTRTK